MKHPNGKTPYPLDTSGITPRPYVTRTLRPIDPPAPPACPITRWTLSREFGYVCAIHLAAALILSLAHPIVASAVGGVA